MQIIIHALPIAYGDPALIREVWVNFLANSLKFTAHTTSAHVAAGGGKASSAARKGGLKTISIVIMTSSHEDQNIVGSYQLGINFYVVKTGRLSAVS